MKRFALLPTLCAALTALSLTGGVLCLSAHSAHAQVKAGRKRGGAAKNPMVEAFKAVSPSADAQTKFDALYATYDTEVKGTTGKTRTERTAKFRTDADALLTGDQVTKFHQGIVVLPIMQRLDRDLMLTPDEKTKVEPILSDYASKTEGMKAKEKRTAMDEVKTKIRAVLTADQQTKLDAMPSLTGRGGAGGKRPGAPGAPAPTTVVAPPAPTAPAAP